MYTFKKQKSAQNFHTLYTNLVKLRKGGRESDRKLQRKRDDDEIIGAMRSGRRDRGR